MALPRARVLHGSGESAEKSEEKSHAPVDAALCVWARSSLVPTAAPAPALKSYGGPVRVARAHAGVRLCVGGDRGRAVCWGVHMQRMDERMTRACATRAHICADVVPTVVRRRSHASWGAVKLKVRVARGVHTGSCVGACTAPRSGAPAGAPRSGAPARAPQSGAPADAVHVQAPRCGAHRVGSRCMILWSRS